MRKSSLVILALVSSFTLSGCQLIDKYRLKKLGDAQATYMLVTPYRGGQCYTRILKGFPIDQVCERRRKLRYTAEPEIPKFAATIPSYVTVLFETRGGEGESYDP